MLTGEAEAGSAKEQNSSEPDGIRVLLPGCEALLLSDAAYAALAVERPCVVFLLCRDPLLSILAGIGTRERGKCGHFQTPGPGSGVEVSVLLSKLPSQENGICSAAESSSGGG